MIKIRGEKVGVLFTLLFLVFAADSVYTGKTQDMVFNPLLNFSGILMLGITLDILFAIGKIVRKGKNSLVKGFVNGILAISVFAASQICAANSHSYLSLRSDSAGDYYMWAGIIIGLVIVITVIADKCIEKRKSLE